MDNNTHAQGKTCKCPHHKVVPLMIVLIGLDLLLGSLNVFSAEFVGYSWPVLLIVIGGTKMFAGSCGCC